MKTSWEAFGSILKNFGLLLASLVVITLLLFACVELVVFLLHHL